MRKRKAFTWVMSAMLTALAILALYPRGASGPTPPAVSGVVPAPSVLQGDQQPQPAARVAPPARVLVPEITEPTPETSESADVQADVEQMDVEPSGVVSGQAAEEDVQFDPEAAGLLPAGTVSEPEATELAEAETPPQAAMVDAEPSGVVVGQAMPEDLPFDPKAAGVTSP